MYIYIYIAGLDALACVREWRRAYLLYWYKIQILTYIYVLQDYKLWRACENGELHVVREFSL